MSIEQLIQDALQTPLPAISYTVGRRLAELFPDKGIVQTESDEFDFCRYAEHGECHIAPSPYGYWETEFGWPLSPQTERTGTFQNTWLDVAWHGQALNLLTMIWTQYGCYIRRQWIVAESREHAVAFYRAVCAWKRIEREVLVFQNGYWDESAALFEAIQGTTFENLILPEPLKSELRDDFARFLASRERYERYRVPWKRGIVLIGPPGNGKTHAVKALLNSVEHPCLYVKSFKSRNQTDHQNIREVFDEARERAPCILVLEDLDSLINDGNRSFFLNELDGFASNSGILTIATTNHPERLDPAILDRPSRFDRKYHFGLPGLPERLAYIRLWNASLEPHLRLSDARVTRVAEETEAYSFAYLKELFVSSLMRWLETEEPGGLDRAVAAQAIFLREQMRAPEGEASYRLVSVADDLLAEAGVEE